MLKKKFLSAILILSGVIFSNGSFAQKIDTTATYSISAYADAYYAYYTDSVAVGTLQKFPTVSPLSNSFGLNIFMVTAQYDAQKVRAMATLHYGDIASSTWSPRYNMIQEAHAGIKLRKKLWLDAGFFRTHFGTEFLLPKENITSSVSVNTYYEPYFEAGFRLNYDPTKRLEINLFALNGYGIYDDNNRKKSFGGGVTYIVNDKTGIGYTNYIGDDSKPTDTIMHLRVHQNAFLNYKYKKIKVQVGGDFCLQQNSDIATGSKLATMYSGVATIRYQMKSKWAVYGRGEVFSDPNGYMSTIIKDKNAKATGYKLWGATAGIEYKPEENAYMRLESRYLKMDKDQEIFHYNGENRSYRLEVMVTMGVWFDLAKGVETKSIKL